MLASTPIDNNGLFNTNAIQLHASLKGWFTAFFSLFVFMGCNI